MNGTTLIQLLLFSVLMPTLGCSQKNEPKNQQLATKTNNLSARPVYNFEDYGQSSYYANSLQGRLMANGNPYNKDAYTAAHRTLPLGTCLKVTNLRNDSTIEVEITDRGPYHPERILDLSRRAAKKLGIIKRGTAPVKIQGFVAPNTD